MRIRSSSIDNRRSRRARESYSRMDLRFDYCDIGNRCGYKGLLPLWYVDGSTHASYGGCRSDSGSLYRAIGISYPREYDHVGRWLHFSGGAPQ